MLPNDKPLGWREAPSPHGLLLLIIIGFIIIKLKNLKSDFESGKELDLSGDNDSYFLLIFPHHVFNNGKEEVFSGHISFFQT